MEQLSFTDSAYISFELDESAVFNPLDEHGRDKHGGGAAK